MAAVRTIKNRTTNNVTKRNDDDEWPMMESRVHNPTGRRVAGWGHSDCLYLFHVRTTQLADYHYSWFARTRRTLPRPSVERSASYILKNMGLKNLNQTILAIFKSKQFSSLLFIYSLVLN